MQWLSVKLEEGGRMPTKGTKLSAGYDLYAPTGGIVYPGDIAVVNTKVRLCIPSGYCGILTHRSSMAARGVHAYGLIDEDYRGELMVTLMNLGPRVFQYKPGDRIAQVRFAEVPAISLLQVSDIPMNTERGEGAHGSTGS